MTLFCPTDADVAAALAVLRPRGDAWRNGGADELAGSVMGLFFDALGAGFGPTHRRFCALVDEYFCSTAVETIDLWAAEHGVPDGCDPFADVCEKVNAVGDTVPAYSVAAASRRGWSIAIGEEFITSPMAGACGLGLAGAAICAAQTGVTWRITVDLAASPSFSGVRRRPALAGLAQAGGALVCPPDIGGLVCLIRRIAPAHADLIFTTIN